MKAFLLLVHSKRRKAKWYTPIREIYSSGDILVYADSFEEAKVKALEFLSAKNPNTEYTSIQSKTIL